MDAGASGARGRAALVAGLLLALASPACGGEEERASQPSIPRDIAEQLAAQSLDVAEALDSGDACGAAELADSLRASVRQAIDRGQVPAPLGSELERAVARLSGEIECVPSGSEEEGRPGEDAGPGENGGGDDGGDDGGATTSTTPDTTPTDTTTTDTTTTVEDTTTTPEETTTPDEG